MEVPSYVRKYLEERVDSGWIPPGLLRRVRDDLKLAGASLSVMDGGTALWGDLLAKETSELALRDGNLPRICRRDVPSEYVAALLLQVWVGFRMGPVRTKENGVSWAAPPILKSCSKPVLALVRETLHPGGVKQLGGTLGRPPGAPQPPGQPLPPEAADAAPPEDGVPPVAEELEYDKYSGPPAADTPPRAALYGGLGTIRGINRIYAAHQAAAAASDASFLAARHTAVASLRNTFNSSNKS